MLSSSGVKRESCFFEVIVMGGGPAGCAAATGAASNGLTVAMIERTTFPRDVPGEALHPDVEMLFSELGVTGSVSHAGFIRFSGWILERSGQRDFIPFAGASGLRFGYQSWRADLDAILLARARDVGATVLQPAIGVEVLLVNGRIAGLQVEFGATALPLSGGCLGQRSLVNAETAPAR